MIEKRTVIDQIEVARDGTVQLRFGLLLIEDGVEIHNHPHRETIAPGDDVTAALAAINAGITTDETLRAAPIDAARIPLLKDICALAHTPEVVRAYRDAQAAKLAEKAAAADEATAAAAALAP